MKKIKDQITTDCEPTFEKIKSSEIHFLIKIFDKEEYADAFIHKGEMFCKTLDEFKHLEDVKRGDKHEATVGCYQPDKMEVAINGEVIPRDSLAGPIVIQRNYYDKSNLYCMYAIEIEKYKISYNTEKERKIIFKRINEIFEKKLNLNEEALSLGKFAVVIYQVNDFIDKVSKAIKKEGFDCQYGLIDYYDSNTFHGQFKEDECIFKKRNSYANQNEFRFVFMNSNTSSGTKIIKIGSLKKIAIKTLVKEIGDKVQVKYR